MLFKRLQPLVVHLGLACERYSISGKRVPDPGDLVKELAVRVLQAQGKRERSDSLKNPVSRVLWLDSGVQQAFGPRAMRLLMAASAGWARRVSQMEVSVKL